MARAIHNIEDFTKKLLENTEDAINGLKLIGAGSSRKVYALNNKYVIKIATGENGICQNRVEVRIWKNMSLENVIANIYYYCSDYSWIIAERVKPRKRISLYSLGVKKIKAISDFNLLEAIEFGINQKGQIVLIDYGFTNHVWRKYYSYEDYYY